MNPQHHKLNDVSKSLRRLILDTVKSSNAGHITSSFSAVEILYALYKHANINIHNLRDKLRDRVIISKEHCRLAQVCVLAHLGLLDKKFLKEYCIDGGLLGHDLYNVVCPDIPAVDIASGSLGHGLGVGAGMAYTDKAHNIYVLCGDGELQEGAMYEALLFIAQKEINNLVVIVDRNSMQIDNYTKNIINTSDHLKERMTSLGFDVIECDGHDVDDLTRALNKTIKLPKCIIANTIKGRGMEFMLERFSFAKYHHSGLTDEEFNVIYEAIENE